MAVTPPVVPVAVAAGPDAWEATQDLRGVPGVRVATTPRHAAVLLVAGTVPAADDEPLRRVHDQLPRPRAVVAWRPAGAAADVPAHRVDGDLRDLVDALRSAQAEVLADPAGGADDLLPDTEPNAWRGVGPFGQGGEGMMGGTPYGRPMTMTGGDRDGLALDQLDLTLGPFLDPLPGGCSLAVTLQGEVLQHVEVTVRPAGRGATVPGDPRDRAVVRLLRRTAHGLHVAGLDALAARAASLALRVAEGGDPRAVDRDARRLARAVRRSGLRWTLRGVGVVDAVDAATRWRTRLDALADSVGATDAPPPAATAIDAGTLSGALAGMTVTDAVATLASFDALGPRHAEVSA
jgi:hypothetical protein